MAFKPFTLGGAFTLGTALAACAVGACALAAAAQTVPAAEPAPHAPPHAPAFEDLDANHDGVVSKAEFDAWRAAHPMHERWGGGFEMRRERMWMHMHEMEMRHGHGGKFGHDLDKIDTDHDGKISWAEFQAAATAHLKERFDRLDKNHDGFISKDELPGRGEPRWRDGRDGKPDSDVPPPAPAK